MAARRLRCVGEHLRVAHLAAAETTVETTEGLEVVLEAPTVEGALAVAFFGATADAATVAAELRDSLSIHTLGQLKAAVDDWDAVAAAVDAPLPLDASTAAALSRFLPCSTGLRVFALAQQTLRKIADGTATTSYNHGLTPNLSAKALAAGYGAAGMTPEKYEIAPPPGVSWTVNVDCAGFIRNTFQAVTGSSVMDPALRPLSDSSFMRAKDYTRFGQRLPLDVRADSSAAGTVAGASAAVMWRKVSDMRDILHGDIISYGQPGGFVRLNEVHTDTANCTRNGRFFKGNSSFFRGISPFFCIFFRKFWEKMACTLEFAGGRHDKLAKQRGLRAAGVCRGLAWATDGSYPREEGPARSGA